MSTLRVTITSKDPDYLPDGMFHDQVLDEVVDVLRRALKAWYDERGKDLLVFEPDF